MLDYRDVVRRNLHRLKQVEAFLPFNNPTFGNPPFEQAPHRLLIVRLSPFRDVDRSIPHLFLFQEARRALPGAFVDMAFFPGGDEQNLFDEEDVPYLLGVQSLHPAEAFDLVLISNSYTLELVNLPYLLIRSGIPLFSSQRGQRWPILILGGSNAAAAQAIVRDDGDSLVDGIFFGEGEGRVASLISLLAQRGGDKRERIVAAARAIGGFWAAGTLDPVSKAVACEPSERHLPTDYPLLNSSEVHTASLQTTYGCPAFCSFCFEGYDRKPYREVHLDDLVSAARRLKIAQGCEELSLYSFNFNAHRNILDLLLALHGLFDRVTFKSQRVDILQRASYLLQAEIEADKRSFTLGIEGISERQRAFVHKSLSTSDVESLLSRLLALRIREIKLFYILTGYETEEDVVEFRQFLRTLKELRRKGKRGIRIIFSFGTLIRMPFTPLRYDRLFLAEDAWRPLIGQVKSACETNGFEFRMAFDWQAYCVTQVMALGGHWLVDPVIDLARQGYCFDAELPTGYWDELRGWMDQNDYWSDAFLGEKGPDTVFPLGFVRASIPDSFLYYQYQQAKAGEDRGYCLGDLDAPGTCLGCGACIDPDQRQAIVHHQLQLPEAGPYLAQLHETVVRKRHLRPAYIVIRLAPWLAGVLPQYLNAYVFREILARCPDLAENLLAVRENLFTLRSNRRFPLMSGETVFALKAWDLQAVSDRILTGWPASEPAGRLQTGIEIVGPAPGFASGEFTRLHLDLYLPSEHFAEPRRVLDQYLREAYVPYSLRRQEGQRTRYRFDVPKKGLKKRVIYAGAFEMDERGLTASLEVGAKFDLLALLDLFGSRHLSRHIRARVSDLRW